jgi:hypothetical protein
MSVMKMPMIVTITPMRVKTSSLDHDEAELDVVGEAETGAGAA